MDLEKHLKEGIQQAFQQEFSAAISLEDIQLQPTRKEFEGSHTFVTFPFLKIAKQSPEEVAERIGAFLKNHTSIVASFNVVKGFLNIVLADQTWLEQLEAIGKEAHWGFLPAKRQKVVIEFSSPNTNKPLHLGHLRNNFLGHAIANILKATGYEVYKVNLVNDRGIHICKSMVAYQQFGKGETPETSGMKGDHLVGKYYVKFDQEYKKQLAAQKSAGKANKEVPLLLAAQAMLKKWEEGDEEVVALWKKMNSWVYEGFDTTYKQIGITFDHIYYESQTYLLGKDIVAEGLAQGVFYKKVDGSVWVDLTEEGLDEKLVLRADGTSVYITQDMGAVDLRFQDYHFDKTIYVVGSEQDYHFDVLFTILKKLGRRYALHHLSYGMVDLPTGKMKSREGTVVDADNLIEEMVRTAEVRTKELGKIEGFSEEEAKQLYHRLAMGALKYFLLKVEPKKRLLFNPQESIDFQGNTGPFIQYTYARIAAILRKAKQEGAIKELDVRNISNLHATERAVIIQLYRFPEKLREAAETYAPSVIAQYVFDLAKVYNRLYAEVSILHKKHASLKRFRVYLSAIVARMIQRSMKLLGIDMPERM